VAIEQEVKLAFVSIEAARQAVETAGGRLVVSRRLISDRLFDTPESHLRNQGATLRIRREEGRGFLTWKGAPRGGPVKSREELETSVGDADVMEATLLALGFGVCFSSEKHREEYALDDAVVTVDETPAGVFVEIEAKPEEIARVAARLGRTADDYRLESYPSLWRRWCEEHGRASCDMLFSHVPASRP
jgi:adenylate cyclase class 2